MEATDSQTNIDRSLLRKRAEKEAMRADMKQHADKLIQGFEKLDERHAKRAIWELFQNAVDISEICKITIEITDDWIVFSHNGKPFTSKTLTCLIKQVSSKNGGANEDEVGQYGTGFISTHTFGKKILVSGSLEVENLFIPIDNFEIDRTAQKSDPELIDKLIEQQDRALDLLLKDGGEECSQFTTFKYYTISQLEKQNAKNAIDSLPEILPYVMVINKKLTSIKVKDKSGKETIYEKGLSTKENDLDVINININGSPKKIYFIQSVPEELTIVLPLSISQEAIFFNDNLARLFLFYPLIGTENFGINFLVHSKQFAPTEPRDGIHLKSDNEQVQVKEKHNRFLLQRAFEIICDFTSVHCQTIKDPIYLARVNFNTRIQNEHLAGFFKGLKKQWVERFTEFKLVETDAGRLSPKETLFFSLELHDEEYSYSIYSISNLFWKNIPKRELTEVWTKRTIEWEDERISYIGITDILSKIQEKGSLDSFPEPEHLKRFYKYLIINGHGEFFNQYALLPNIKNEFRKRSNLYSTVYIDDILSKVADVIIPETTKRFINPEFKLGLNFEDYDRKQFSKDINSEIADNSKAINVSTLLQNETLVALITYCKIFPDLDNTGTRGKLIKLACEYYDIESAFYKLPIVADQEIDWTTPSKCLLRNLIWDLNSKNQDWLKFNIELLKKLVSVIYKYSDFEEIVQTLPVFPNQNYTLCKQNELKIDGHIPEDLKKLYDKIIKEIDDKTKPQKSIKSTLLLEGFEEYLIGNESKFPVSLGIEIESIFEKEAPFIEINAHPHKTEILWLIQKISNDTRWGKYFQTIDEKKATIMMARISDNETKNDLFSIIGLDKSKIALLGELSRQKDIARIIELGKEALEEEKRIHTDFEFRYTIGTNLEKLIREKLGSDLTNLEVTVNNQQGGQDIVISFNGNIIYYIEVKSRWDSRSSITMSPLQMSNAVANKFRYSLCCIDMTNFKNGDPDRYNVKDIQDISSRINVLNDIGVRLDPLLTGLIAVTDIENQISITGDYRGTIPQTIVKTGESLEKFVDLLIALIRKEKTTEVTTSI